MTTTGLPHTDCSNLMILIVLMLIGPFAASGQSHNYWTRSFNEESSLLSGAVVGGGAGPSAIYYNPSSISEITESKFSLHASLFSLDFTAIQNALGEGLNLNSSRITLAPRFLSYMIKPRDHPEWSFEFAFLNNENHRVDFTENVDRLQDVLTQLPGEERYYAFFQYSNRYRDDWFGAGGSWNINRRLYLGASMFIIVRSLEYRLNLDIDAFPVADTVYVGGEPVPFYSANYQFEEYVKFNNYRLLWKFGMMYSKNNWSIGWTLTTPSLGVYSDGKKVSRKVKENNIHDPETGEPMPGFVIAGYKEKKAMHVNFKSPLSFAAGMNYRLRSGDQTLYSTVEYFGHLAKYAMVDADEDPLQGVGSVMRDIEFNNWLTFLQNARPVFNVALGYRSQIRDDLMLMTGFRTDFNYRKGEEYDAYIFNREIKGSDLDIYHLSGGLALTIKGQDLIAGLQYSFGYQGNQQQILNLSDPVEYNTTEQAALQGTRQNTMTSLKNSLSVYFGATFNFGTKKE